MISILKYGAGHSVCLDIPPDALVADCDAPRGTPLADVRDSLLAALTDPLHFPPLAQAVVPGDKVAIAVERDVPQAAELVAGVVEQLLTAGASASDITIVQVGSSAQADAAVGEIDLRGALPAELREQIASNVHNPESRDSLSYLGSSAENKPIYINRSIHDADFIVPIGCLRPEESLDYHGVSGSVFPAFSDNKSLERYRSPTAVESVVQRKRLRKDADEVGWMLGAAFTVQVVPGAGEQILHVLAGDPQAVFTRGQALAHEAWSFSVPHRAELVVASIEGNAAQQTWDNVARALWTASRAVADDGVIALCTELGERFGPALQRIAGADDLHEAMQEIIKVRPADALPATQLVHALERVKVYLLSRLDENLVEELGVAPVADEHQLKRLVEHHDSCIVLSNAHYAVAMVEDES